MLTPSRRCTPARLSRRDAARAWRSFAAAAFSSLLLFALFTPVLAQGQNENEQKALRLVEEVTFFKERRARARRESLFDVAA